MDSTSTLPSGFSLLPYQHDWTMDASPVKWLEKSRQVGLTFTEALDDVILASTEGRAGMDVWYVGYNLSMTFEFLRDCEFHIPRVQAKVNEINKANAVENEEGNKLAHTEEIIIKDGDKDVLAYRITFASGHRITGIPSRASVLRGKRGKAVIDEAAFHEDLPAVLKAATALLMWGGRLVVMSTHLGEASHFNDKIKELKEANVQALAAGKKPTATIHKITFAEAVADGLYRKICEVNGNEWSHEAELEWVDDMYTTYGEDAAEELDCVPSQASGAFFSRAMLDHATQPSPVISWTCPAGFEQLPDEERKAKAKEWLETSVAPYFPLLKENKFHWFGQDFGRSGDLTVIWPVEEVTSITYQTPFVVELRNVPFREQEQILNFILDALPNFQGGCMDSRGNGQALAEFAMQRYGADRIMQVMLTVGIYRDAFPPYKAAIENREFTLPDSKDVRDDHLLVKMRSGVARIPENAKNKGSDGKFRHADSAVAGMLAHYATRKLTHQPPAYKRVVRRGTAGFRESSETTHRRSN